MPAITTVAQPAASRSVPVDQAGVGFSLSVSPQLIDLSGAPGGRRSFPISVRNADAVRTLRAHLWVADVIQQPNGAVTFRERVSYRYSCADWLQIDQPSLVLGPGQQKQSMVTLQVPGGNLAGSFHAVIGVSGSPPESVDIAPVGENQPFSYMRTAFGVIVHFSVAGTLRPSAEIAPMFLSNLPSPGSGLTPQTAGAAHWLVVPVKNIGNTMLYGYGWAMLRNRAGGGMVQRWRIGQREYGSRVVVYPDKRVDLYLPIDRPLAAGEYVAQARLEYAENRAIKMDSVFTVTPEQVKEGFARIEGPFESATVGLSLTLESEFSAIAVAPGGLRTGWVTVSNNESEHVQVTAQALDAVIDSDGVISPNALADDLQMPVSQWLKLKPDQFPLPPGGHRRVQYSVSPPREPASKRDLVGFLQFRSRTRDALARTVADETIGETGHLLVVTLAGAGRRAVDVGTLQVDTRPELPGVVRFGVPLRNSGDIHCFPVATLRLQGETDPSYRHEVQVGMAEDRVLLLPTMQRMMWIPLAQ